MIEDRTIRTQQSPAPRIHETLAAAFQDDPGLAWIMPDPEVRRRMLPRFFAIMARQSHRYGGVLASPTLKTAALLYPAGKVRDGTVWDSLELLMILKFGLRRGLTVAKEMHARHPDPQPYSYLRFVGVSPEFQGQGWGGTILRDIVARAAQQSQGVLLETATESNVAIYSRLGFEITEEWRVPGGGPTFWTMVRDHAA